MALALCLLINNIVPALAYGDELYYASPTYDRQKPETPSSALLHPYRSPPPPSPSTSPSYIYKSPPPLSPTPPPPNIYKSPPPPSPSPPPPYIYKLLLLLTFTSHPRPHLLHLLLHVFTCLLPRLLHHHLQRTSINLLLHHLRHLHHYIFISPHLHLHLILHPLLISTNPHYLHSHPLHHHHLHHHLHLMSISLLHLLHHHLPHLLHLMCTSPHRPHLPHLHLPMPINHHHRHLHHFVQLIFTSLFRHVLHLLSRHITKSLHHSINANHKFCLVKGA